MEPSLGVIGWLAVIAAAAYAFWLSIYNAVNRTGSGAYLCEDCQFNDAESCKKVERPRALECTSYRVASSTTCGDSEIASGGSSGCAGCDRADS